MRPLPAPHTGGNSSSHVALYASHVMRHASLVTRHTSHVTRHRGRIDFTTEGDAGAGAAGGGGGAGVGGGAVSWIPSLADEARDYIESIHAHSR